MPNSPAIGRWKLWSVAQELKDTLRIVDSQPNSSEFGGVQLDRLMSLLVIQSFFENPLRKLLPKKHEAVESRNFFYRVAKLRKKALRDQSIPLSRVRWSTLPEPEIDLKSHSTFIIKEYIHADQASKLQESPSDMFRQSLPGK